MGDPKAEFPVLKSAMEKWVFIIIGKWKKVSSSFFAKDIAKLKNPQTFQIFSPYFSIGYTKILFWISRSVTLVLARERK